MSNNSGFSQIKNFYKAVEDPRVSTKDVQPLAQKFFIFMQFSGKIGQIIGWCLPLEFAPPPLGNPGSATARHYVENHN